MVLRVREGRNPPLRHDVVRVTLAETGALKQVHDVRLACTLLVQAVFILLETDSASEDDLLPAGRESIVRVVEDNLNWDAEVIRR